MIDIKLIRESPDKVKSWIATKNVDPKLVDEFLKLDAAWRKLENSLDELRAKQKKLSAERKIDEAKSLKDEIKLKEAQLTEAYQKRDEVLRLIPNTPLSEVPVGKSEKDNVVVREVGKKPKFDFKPSDYLGLADEHDFIDMERAAKVSGSRFGYLLGDAARLEFALVDLGLKTLTDRSLISKLARKNHLNIPDVPFRPVIPPVLVGERAMRGMGKLERGSDEVYYLPKDNLYLVGTSEQSIGPMHIDETFEEKELPFRYLGFSTCFRREAGSYGKDTKGILRVHQFDKLEMFSFTKPEWSRAEHRLMLSLEEYLVQLLGLPYRILNICTADLADPCAATFDVETWMPGQRDGAGEYRETHSASNTTDYQARRLNIRYKPMSSQKPETRGQKPEFVHMLNGTAFAIGRTLIAIMENYQTKEGKIKVPKVLQKYVGKKIIG